MQRLAFAVLFALIAGSASAAQSVSLHALFKDKAIFVIDGTRRVLTTGQSSPEGVRLIATDTAAEQAEIEIGGRRETVKLGMVMSGFQPANRATVVLWPGGGGQYRTEGMINGQSVRFLVDTGATTIALSGDEATRLGIDFRKRGRVGYASTASGVVRAYSLTLDKVELGAIALYNVEAGVIEGSFPSEVLLGMSFLGRLNMKREGEQLELTTR
jgi:aspartyl protease family protein